MTFSANWTPTHRYARILRNHNAWLGFWFARGEDGTEFAISLFGRTFHL
jgi:hypothetical protein